MNLLLTWTLFGSFIGFSLHFLGINTKGKSIAMAILLGVLGALVGGVIGYYLNVTLQDTHVAPFLTMGLGSFLTSVIPTGSKD